MEHSAAIAAATKALDKANQESPQDRIFSVQYAFKEADQKAHINRHNAEEERNKILAMLYIAIYELSDRKAITPSVASFLRGVLNLGMDDDIAWPLKKANKVAREAALEDAAYIGLMGDAPLLEVAAYGIVAKGGYSPNEVNALAALYEKAS